MTRRIRRKEEELRRRRAQRASELAFASRSVGLTDLHAPRPPELSQVQVRRKEEETRRAYATQSHAFGLTVGLGNAAAETAARQAMPSADHRVDVHRSRRMGADLLARSSEPAWHDDGRYTVRDEQAGLDVTYDPSGGAPDVDLKQVEGGLGGGAPLDSQTREYMEWRFGVSFEKVRIHNSSKAGAISKALFAHAFALGGDVAFAPGNYRPGTREGDRLLAHELTHVVQAGLTRPLTDAEHGQLGGGKAAFKSTDAATAARSIQKKGSVSEPTDAFELEADRVADLVVGLGRGDQARTRRELEATARKAEQQEQDEEEDKKGTAAAKVDSALGGAGKALDPQVQQRLEGHFDRSLSGVRVHDGAQAGDAAEAIHAEAFTAGSDIVFGPGKYRPGTAEGDALIAHEVTHVVQNLEGRGGQATDTVDGVPVTTAGDAVEREAEGVAQAVASGAIAPEAPAVEGPAAEAPAQEATVERAAASGAVQREESQEGGGDIEFTLKLLDDLKIEIKGSKAKKPTYTQSVDFPGLKNAKVVLNLSEGKVTGGVVKGSAAPPEISGAVEFTVGTDGKVGGTSDARWVCKDFGEGDVTLKPLMGCLAGTGEITVAEVKAGSDLAVTEFTGQIRVYGASDSVTAKGTGKGSLAEGQLPGDLTLEYQTGIGTKGSLIADVEIAGFKKAFENGQVTGKGGEPLPKFNLDYKAGVWSGDQVVPYDKSAPGMAGDSDVNLSYKSGKFSGTGDGTFEIADFLKGTVSNSVGSDGSVNGTFKIETNSFAIGPVTCEKISLQGGIKDDVVDLKASGSLTAFDGKAKGTFSSNLAETGGLTWNGTINLDIPQMKKAEVKLTYVVGQGFTGEGTVAPKIPAITGEGKLKFDGKKLSGEAEFDVDLPLLEGAKVKAKYADGKFSGSTAIQAGAVKIPNITITSSSLQADFGDEFKISGSCGATMAGGQVSGTLNMSYGGGKFDADMSTMFNIPGINPVQLDLKYGGGKLSGEAKATLNLPMADDASVTVYYRNEKFGGKGNVGFNVPGLNRVEGQVEITPEGVLNGSLSIKPKDFQIPPLTVEQCDITGKITNGKLSIEGGGTVKGIPLTESATLKASYSEAEGFGGTIETSLKIPGLKEAKAKLGLKAGKVSGSVSCKADMAGFEGGVEVKYNDGAWSGSGTLAYKKGKFDGSVTVNIGESGKLSGKGSVGYKISDNFKVTAELELREDQSMVIGGKIECPDKVELFKKEYEKNLFKMKGRFGIPGLSIQVPVVGVIGLEAQLSGSLDFKAGLDIFLTDITAAGSFDTATGDVDLELGGTVKGQAHAGIYASARLAVGLGVGPAFIGGYVQVTGSARAEAEVYAGVNAKYKTGGPLKLNFSAGASAGLVLGLTISGGITASVDLWVKTLKKDWELASKTWEYRPGGKLEYKKDFDYELGSAVSPSMLEPTSTPKIDGNEMAKKAGGQADI